MMKRAKQNNLRRLKSRYVAGDDILLGGVYLDGIQQYGVIEVNIKRGFVKRYRMKQIELTESPFGGKTTMSIIETCPVTGERIIEKVRGKVRVVFV